MTDSTSDKFREKASETRDNIADMGHMAKDVIQDKYREFKDRAAAKYGDGKDRMHELEDSLVGKVREAPVKSVLIAAGVGLALGFLWRRS